MFYSGDIRVDGKKAKKKSQEVWKIKDNSPEDSESMWSNSFYFRSLAS